MGACHPVLPIPSTLSGVRSQVPPRKLWYPPSGSMPLGLPGIGLSPGVLLVPGVGASFLGVGVLDLSPGVDDLSFWMQEKKPKK